MIIADAPGPANMSCGFVEDLQAVTHTNVFEALRDLHNAEWDAVLIHLPVAGWTGDELLEEVRRGAPASPCLVQGAPGEDWMQAVRLIKLGAYSWLPAEASPADRLTALESALRERVSMRPPTQPAAEPWRRFLVGDTAAVRQVTTRFAWLGRGVLRC